MRLCLIYTITSNELRIQSKHQSFVIKEKFTSYLFLKGSVWVKGRLPGEAATKDQTASQSCPGVKLQEQLSWVPRVQPFAYLHAGGEDPQFFIHWRHMSCHDRDCWDTASLRIFFTAFIPIFGYCEVFVKNLGDFQCLKDMKFGKKDDKTEYSYFTWMSKI